MLPRTPAERVAYRAEMNRRFDTGMLAGFGAIWLGAVVTVAALAGCTAPDIGPDPALSNVKIVYLEMPADKIAEVGKKVPVMRAHWTPLAYSILDRFGKQCVVVLPPRASTDPALWMRLKVHEDRHCRGEQHPGKARFDDEFSFAAREERR